MTDSSIIIALPRVGKGGKIIRVYKFRTMCPGAQHMQALVYATCGLDVCGKFKDDFRITKTGRILRKYWIDELPMLINLLKGDIKLFGVRPISEHYLSLYNDEVRQRRVKYKPGLIPPLYADQPQGLEEIQLSELNYFNAYDKNPVMTDLRYLIKALTNILFKSARSK